MAAHTDVMAARMEQVIMAEDALNKALQTEQPVKISVCGAQIDCNFVDMFDSVINLLAEFKDMLATEVLYAGSNS